MKEMTIMDSGTTTNLFGNPRIITNREKTEITVDFMINTGSKIVDKVGEIPGAG